MNLLDVSRNRIDAVGAEHLSQCVPNLKHLWMQKCNLNASNIEIISNEILKRSTPVRKQIMKMCSCILVSVSLYAKFSNLKFEQFDPRFDTTVMCLLDGNFTLVSK